MAPSDSRRERGAITIHVALALIAMLAFSSLVIDYGVMWVSRRQAQNAADAGALAGAVSLVRDGGTTPMARLSAEALAARNVIWGQANTAGSGGNIIVAVSGNGVGEDPTVRPCLAQPGCVRVDVLRNEPARGGTTPVGAPLPTFFANIVGIGSQGVRATATAQVRAGNQVSCLLPFAVIDRWADNADTLKDTTFFPTDDQAGTLGWSPNDFYEPTATPRPDLYFAPYGNNAGHSGWRVIGDYGRQLVIKDGTPGLYPAGWGKLITLPGGTVTTDILGCNPQAVGMATSATCTPGDDAHGCVNVTASIADTDVQAAIPGLVASDSSAFWNPTAPGPGSQPGAVVGGQGMDSPRIRPIAVLDINNYVCSGGSCFANVANIIGFFVEGLCNAPSVTLDTGMSCTTGDIVGRIMTIPGRLATGVGTVDPSASFVRVVQLVR